MLHLEHLEEIHAKSYKLAHHTYKLLSDYFGECKK